MSMFSVMPQSDRSRCIKRGLLLINPSNNSQSLPSYFFIILVLIYAAVGPTFSFLTLPATEPLYESFLPNPGDPFEKRVGDGLDPKLLFLLSLNIGEVASAFYGSSYLLAIWICVSLLSSLKKLDAKLIIYSGFTLLFNPINNIRIVLGTI